jgi:replicative DNA helicase
MQPQNKNQPVMHWEKHPNGAVTGTPKLSAAELALMGKPMPQAKRFEEEVLGAMMCSPNAYVLSQGNLSLSVDDFYDDRYRAIWRAIQTLGDAQAPIDLITVMQELKRTNNLYVTEGDSIFKPSPLLLSELTNRIASDANLEYHCAILRQYAIKRGVIKACNEAMEKAYREDVDCFDLMDETQLRLGALTEGIGGMELNILQTTDKIMADALNPEAGKGAIKTGYPDLDKALGGGLYPKDRIVLLAGLPGSGKTSFCIGTIVQNMKDNIASCFVSYDMDGEEIVLRLISFFSGISALDMRKGTVRESEIALMMEARNWIEAHLHLLIIIDAAGMTGNVLVSKMISLAKTKGIKKFFIDYFTAIPLAEGGKFSNETKQQADLIKAIKGAMQKVKAHCVILSQFTKEGGKKEGRLTMMDIKGTGELGSTASIVIIINREGDSMNGDFDIVKVRNTSPCIVPATYIGNSYRWRCGVDSSDTQPDLYGNDGLDNFF